VLSFCEKDIFGGGCVCTLMLFCGGNDKLDKFG
jgi:hypothetical protein